MKKSFTVILFLFISSLIFAAARPSLDGRAIVAEEGVLPQGLFAKTVGYLPGDSVSVTNPNTGVVTEVLILGAIDPSEGVAILLSPEAAQQLGIKRNSNIQVKITKRTSNDGAFSGKAVLANADGSIAEIEEDDEFIQNTTLPVESTENLESAENSESSENVENRITENTEYNEEYEDTGVSFEEDLALVEKPSPLELMEMGESKVKDQLASDTDNNDFGELSYLVEDEKESQVNSPVLENTEIAENTETVETVETVESEKIPEEDAVEEKIELAENVSEPVQNVEVEDKTDEIQVEEPYAEENIVQAQTPAEDEVKEELVEDDILAEITDQNIDKEDQLESEAEVIVEDTLELAKTEDEEPVADLTAPQVNLNLAEENKNEEKEELKLEEENSYAPIVLEPSVLKNASDEEQPKNEEVQNKKDEEKSVCLDKKSDISSYVKNVCELDRSKYYVQIATLGDEKIIEQLIKKYSKYPLFLLKKASSNDYSVLAGPASVDEYGVLLAKFKSFGYKDAFVKKIDAETVTSYENSTAVRTSAPEK